ncbi:uncharacterized protein LOC108341674 [Vigna angularis]|uniref:uncharacterized protein LOC108341674 n=1 Tax=Phaseolus angularis TaxID=3914 RepID=UPI0022B3F7D0|nr:uncharacterized protein LOC108341674 [Vigna angularis]
MGDVSEGGRQKVVRKDFSKIFFGKRKGRRPGGWGIFSKKAGGFWRKKRREIGDEVVRRRFSRFSERRKGGGGISLFFILEDPSLRSFSPFSHLQRETEGSRRRPSNEDALHSPLQVGGNSHVQDEHEQDENQDTLLEVEQKRPPTHKGAWLVDVIDDQCKMTTKHLKTNDVWNLSQNERIIVHWNEEYQPIGDGGALLNRFLGSIARNFKAKFVVNSDIQINYILKALNHKWRDCRLELWQQRDDGTRTRDELIAMAPESIDRDHWASFVDYRLDERTKIVLVWNRLKSITLQPTNAL